MANDGQRRKPTKRQGAGRPAPTPRPSRPATGVSRPAPVRRASSPSMPKTGLSARTPKPVKPKLEALTPTPKPKAAPKPKPSPKAAPTPRIAGKTDGHKVPQFAKGKEGRVRLPFGAKKQVANPAPATAKTPPFLAPTPQQRRAERRSGGKEGSSLPFRQIAIGAAVMAALIAVAAVVILVLSQTPAFTIENVTAVASDHVTKETLVKLANVPEGSTLLNVDEGAVSEAVMRNPWVEEVHLHRKFPDTLEITVKERKVEALVVMNSGDVVWCLGEGDVWIEPISIDVPEDQDSNAVALAKAQELGALLVTDSPASVSPVAGAKVTDESLLAVAEFQSDFSSNFSSQVVSYSASSATSISCILDNGVTVSLGSATDIASKETAVRSILDKYPHRVTYINVRVPSNPSYRAIDSEDVTGGTGAGDVEGSAA